MLSGVKITLEGRPDVVQRMADALETAFPGDMIWLDVAQTVGVETVAIEGYGQRDARRAPARCLHNG